MLLFRIGVYLLPLFISACSLPILHKPTQPETEQTQQKSPKTQQETTSSSVKTSISNVLVSKLDKQITLANSQYSELNARSGSAPSMPSINKNDLTTQLAITNAINNLQSYNSKVDTLLNAVDTRLDRRKKSGLPGDVIQIFVSKANVTLPNSSFKTQPVIGQWVRGESRTIRLKDSLLFDALHSEDLRITYSENYQLLVNHKVVSVIDPSINKSQASFKVDTPENGGSIAGSLDYRMVEGNR